MTNEEAIKELSYDNTDYGGNCTYEVRMAAIKALRKQIPMKPNNIKDILDFSPGTIIELDKLAGEPIDVLVNGKFVAKGEVVVIEESFGIRVTEIIKE